MVDEFLGTVCLPLGSSTFSIGAMFPDFVGLVQEACGNYMFGACVNHCVRADMDLCIPCKGLTILLIFDVDGQWFVHVHSLVKEDFVVVDQSVSYENQWVESMEDKCPGRCFVVSFIRALESGKAIIWDGINELILKDGLNGDGGVKLF